MVAIPKIATVVAGLFNSSIPGFPTQPGVCNLSNTSLLLSPTQTTALGSTTARLTAVGVAFGVQNYTCSANNVFVCVPVPWMRSLLKLIEMTDRLVPLPRFSISPVSRVPTVNSYRPYTMTCSTYGTALVPKMSRSSN